MIDELVIETRNLNWAYNGIKVLDNVSMDIRFGTFTGILGPNGAGKTTLIKLILNLLQVEKNSILIRGKDIKFYSRKELAKIEAYVPQNVKIDFHFTVEQVVLMGRTPFMGRFDRESQKDIQIAEWAMKETGVLKFKDKLITQLSGGELQRVVIARALAQEPIIMVLDEPTSHLDIHHQISILSILRVLAKREGLTIIAVLHDINLALEYCDNLFLLDQGKIVNSGFPEKVITPEIMKDVYNLNVKITKNPFTGNIHMIHDYA
ncbi:MAG: ABC transporter ATP-binding protein [Spirochaetaceae bacterium]|nr:ABC transporter ATP-binding protein [Spirochaetaceae bacterium]